MSTIDEIHISGKLPVVCGGTNYYIEALLFSEVQGSDFNLTDFSKKVESLRALATIDQGVLDSFEEHLPLDQK